ncbi:MAG TPA: VOC family protein [Ramlibacter sp.]|jgi:PhnB protein|nr:VOC family protein [Ramlibacter sp.]
MPVLDSYLFFTNGQCAQAMRFYEQTLGARIEMQMKYADSPEPDHCPAGAADLVMHASLKVGDRTLMASDVPPGMGDAAPMGGFALSLAYDTAAEGRRIFDAMAQGGKVTMPMQKTFWAEAFGMLVDRFGTPWMVSGGPQNP